MRIAAITPVVSTLLIAGILAGPTWAQLRRETKEPAPADFDLRGIFSSGQTPANLQSNGLVDRRKSAMAAFVAERQVAQPGIRIVPSRHGIPKLFLRDGQALSAASNRDPDDIVRDFLRANTAVFPFSESEIDELRLSVRDVSAEATHLVYNQTLKGIDVFEGQLKFTLSNTGEVIQVGSGEIVPGVGISTVPTLQSADAERAGRSAARAETTGTVLRAPELVIFPLDASSARLAYRLFLDVDAVRLYEILIDAESGELLFRHNTYVRATQANVWIQSPSQGSRQVVTFPDGWLPAAATITTGNNVDAYIDADGNDKPDSTLNTGGLQGGRPVGPTHLFDFPFGDGTVGSDPRDYKAASATNLFYFVNVAHDFYYALGFTEAAGNFQTDNLGKGGLGGDAVLAEAQSGAFINNAAFAPTPDGTPPHIRMGLFTRSTPSQTDDLDADYDGQTVIHEYGHGVSNRLVGGRTSTSCLSQVQSGALGEGWSDYFAISYFNNPVFGGYLSQNFVAGVRRQSYEGYTFTYEDLGNSGYEIHDDGEIWAATLWDLRKSLGQSATDQLVINGLKATPCNPSMTDARDAIVTADLASNAGANRASIWTIFAKHGLGFSARGIDGSAQTGTLYDSAYDLPPDLQSAKNPVITSQPDSTPIVLGELFAYTVTASNPNAGVLSFMLTSGPPGMTVSSAGLVNWIAGSFTGQRVKITVTDGQGGKVVHGFLVPVISHLNDGQSLVISGGEGSTGYAFIDVPTGATVLQVTTRAGDGDPDLFVADPDGHFQSSTRDGANETLSFPNPKAGRWRVEVDAFETYLGVVLQASTASPTPLSSTTVLTNLNGVTGSETLYRLTIPPNLTSFQISTVGLTGDVDLFLKFGSPAVCAESLLVSTACVYDYYSAKIGNVETISVLNPTPGDWYIDLSGFEEFSGVTLTISIVEGPPQPDLIVSLSQLGTVTPGQSDAMYTIIVTNVGPGPTRSPVTVKLALAIGLSFQTVTTAGWNCPQGTTCTRNDTLPPSSSYSPLTFKLFVAQNAPDHLTSTATVSVSGEINTANNSATDEAVVTQPDLTISKTHIGNFTPGQTGAKYSISVTNSGLLATIGQVTVIDSLPTGLTATAIGGSGWTCVLGTLTCLRSDVSVPSASYPPIAVTVNVAADAPANVTNTAFVSGGGEINTTNDTAHDPTVIGNSTALTITLVANAFGDAPLIAPNTWVEIKGSNLAPDSRTWLDSDFVNNQMPTQLDGVSVTVNGKSAYVYFVSSGQINILTPPDALAGPVGVQVTNNGGLSNAMTVQAQAQSLSFFEFVSGSGLHYVYGRHTDSTNSLAGPPGLFPAAPDATTPVKPGEVIYVAATGFGPTDVPVVSGSVTQLGNLPSPFPVVKVGGVAATVSFAGLVGVGTDAIFFKVPDDLPDGDLPLTATYNGLSIQPNLLITVHH